MTFMVATLIESWGDLPKAQGAGAFVQERVWFDFKETYATGKRAEMAKDIAAFANAEGGALIIGAAEDVTGPDYSHPLSASYATKLEDDFDKAIRDFCRPSPTVHIRTIPVPATTGKVVLVVNVEPFVDQPVAARHETEQDMWRFPQRVGRHTECLLPEQLPLHMNTKARRAKLLLLRVLAAGGQIDLFYVPSGDSRHATIQGPSPFRVMTVDKDGGGAVVVHGPDGDNEQSATIPLDDIDAVWLQHTGRWAVRTAGRLEYWDSIDGKSVHALLYTPPSTFVVSPLGRVLEDIPKRLGDVASSLKNTLVVQHHPRREPATEEIAARAYELWTARRKHDVPGCAEDDWTRARAQLLAAARNS